MSTTTTTTREKLQEKRVSCPQHNRLCPLRADDAPETINELLIINEGVIRTSVELAGRGAILHSSRLPGITSTVSPGVAGGGASWPSPPP